MRRKVVVIDQQVLSILEERLSSLTARSLLLRCTAALGIRPSDLEARHLPELTRKLAVGVRLFVDPDHQRVLLGRIRTLGGASRTTPEEIVIPIRCEADVARARATARHLATDLSTAFVVQKIVTAVSELARNIALYAGSGEVTLVASDTPEPRLKVVAADRGPGIKDIEYVFSGHYKSRTGLGRGLMSVRRMADAFDVQTSPEGTLLQVEFVL